MLRSYYLPSLHVREFTTEVPLDWAAADAGRPTEALQLFVRELTAPEKRDDDLPLLTFHQGGPGGKGPRPLGPSTWIGEAVKSHRVVLIDQRGTGRSTPVDTATMAALSPAEGANYLAMFRADSIVRDAEHVRTTIYEGKRWESLGQSYGGFITMSYLSTHPEGMAAAYVTGGIPGITEAGGVSADTVYRHTFPRTTAKNEEFYSRYPFHAETTARLNEVLRADEIRLPGGDRLTVRRLQTFGQGFGMKPGFERLHYLLDEAFTPAGRISDTFLAQVEQSTGFGTNPLYFALQEAIYADGPQATGWAAHRVRAEFPDYDAESGRLLFTGEMMFPWMTEEYAELRPFAGAVHALHEERDWPGLFDPARLAANEVPLAAMVYFDDMYVDSGLQLATLGRTGHSHNWVSNEWEHDGLHEAGPRILNTLREKVAGISGPLRG